jgi:hypothetical protein
LGKSELADFAVKKGEYGWGRKPVSSCEHTSGGNAKMKFGHRKLKVK